MKKKVILIILVIFIGCLAFGIYTAKKYFDSTEYKLKKVGYSKVEVTDILKLDKSSVDIFLTLDYNKNIIKFVKETYFIKKNLNQYLEYIKTNKSKEISDIVSIVNVGANKDFYTDIKKTDMSNDYLILVNKYNYLDPNYTPEDLVTMSLQYAFNGKQIRTEVNSAFKQMANAAKAESLKIVANSAYRDNAYQTRIYENIKDDKGEEYADNYAARPGHSEHQTGLSIDISTLSSTLDGFEVTPEFTWLKENSYKFGFILRYPEGKEYLTGYQYEPWHYRYVGIEVATKIKDLGITFDEYYAYFID